MKRILIIPTYTNHFQLNKLFLASVQKYVIDKHLIDIYFITGNNAEKKTLTQLLKDFTALNVRIETLEHILRHYGLHIKAKNLLDMIGRFSYQTTKKLYALRYLIFDQALVIDSESQFITSASINQLFDDYFKDRYIFYSEVNRRPFFKNTHAYRILHNCIDLLNINPAPKCNWYLETFTWFYDKSIIDDFFKFFGKELLQLLLNQYKVGRLDYFECLLYYIFISGHNKKYKYRFINVHQLLSKELSVKEYKSFIHAYNQLERAGVGLGYLEHFTSYITKRNISVFIHLSSQYNLQIMRLSELEKNLTLKKQFIKNAKIKLIVSTDNVDCAINDLFNECHIPAKSSISVDNMLVKHNVPIMILKRIILNLLKLIKSLLPLRTRNFIAKVLEHTSFILKQE